MKWRFNNRVLMVFSLTSSLLCGLSQPTSEELAFSPFGLGFTFLYNHTRPANLTVEQATDNPGIIRLVNRAYNNEMATLPFYVYKYKEQFYGAQLRVRSDVENLWNDMDLSRIASLSPQYVVKVQLYSATDKIKIIPLLTTYLFANDVLELPVAKYGNEVSVRCEPLLVTTFSCSSKKSSCSKKQLVAHSAVSLGTYTHEQLLKSNTTYYFVGPHYGDGSSGSEPLYRADSQESPFFVQVVDPKKNPFSIYSFDIAVVGGGDNALTHKEYVALSNDQVGGVHKLATLDLVQQQKERQRIERVVAEVTALREQEVQSLVEKSYQESPEGMRQEELKQLESRRQELQKRLSQAQETLMQEQNRHANYEIQTPVNATPEFKKEQLRLFRASSNQVKAAQAAVTALQQELVSLAGQ